MNRTLTAAIALAAGLGMAGMAQAQQNSDNYEHGGKPTSGQQGAPSGFTSPGTSSTQPMPAPSQAAPMQSGPQASTMPSTGSEAQPSTMRHASMHERMMRGGREHNTVADAQRELQSQGLYKGPIDGVMGRETKTALSQFQQQNGLKQSAQLDRQTRDKLSQAGTGTSSTSQPTTGAAQPQPAIPPGNMPPQPPAGTNTH
jgi:peptidoglycan hydrolase-like protein with peptidoglycan-binding domain